MQSGKKFVAEWFIPFFQCSFGKMGQILTTERSGKEPRWAGDHVLLLHPLPKDLEASVCVT